MNLSDAKHAVTPAATPDPWDLSEVGNAAIQAEIARPLSWTDLNWAELLGSHWHNRLVHVPLILLAVSIWLSWRSASHNQAEASLQQRLANRLLAFAMLMTFPTVMTGLLQAGPFELSAKSLFLFWHRNLGIFSATALLGLVLWSPGGRRQALAGSLVLLVMLLVGLLGGVLGSH